MYMLLLSEAGKNGLDRLAPDTRPDTDPSAGRVVDIRAAHEVTVRPLAAAPQIGLIALDVLRDRPGEDGSKDMEDVIVRIAIATDDGRTIGRHFGRARMYAVLTVHEGGVTSRQLRDKSAPHWLASRPPDDLPAGREHGTDPAAAEKHAEMFDPIRDCDCLIAGGMGRGAYDHAKAAGIRPVVTSLEDIDQAAIECAAGRLVDESERLH
jgi:predicted Fe-Mo cluster-binding NifX family protein